MLSMLEFRYSGELEPDNDQVVVKPNRLVAVLRNILQFHWAERELQAPSSQTSSTRKDGDGSNFDILENILTPMSSKSKLSLNTTPPLAISSCHSSNDCQHSFFPSGEQRTGAISTNNSSDDKTSVTEHSWLSLPGKCRIGLFSNVVPQCVAGICVCPNAFYHIATSVGEQ